MQVDWSIVLSECQENSECFLTGSLKCRQKNEICKADSNTSANENNKHRVSPSN